MSNRVVEIIKFIFFILLVPFVVACTVGFAGEIEALPRRLAGFFISGIWAYLLVHLFIFELQLVYQYGQNLVSSIFRFFAPLVKVAPFFLPIFSILALILFYFTALFFKSAELGYALIFLVSFTFTMHMVLTARALRGKDTNALKPNYFFAMSLIYVINLIILAGMFDLILDGFSFSSFFETATAMTAGVYKVVFNQLFVPE